MNKLFKKALSATLGLMLALPSFIIAEATTPEVQTLSRTQETVINAADYAGAYGTNTKSSGSDTARFAIAATMTEATKIAIPFTVSAKQTFSIKLDTTAKVNNTDSGYSALVPLYMTINNGTSDTLAKTLLWDYNTNVSSTQGAHIWNFQSRIIEYTGAVTLEAGTYTLFFEPENSNYGYRATVGNVTFVPHGAASPATLSRTENTVVNAADYVAYGENVKSGFERGNYAIANGEGVPKISVPFTVDSGQNFKIRVDTTAKVNTTDKYAALCAMGMTITKDEATILNLPLLFDYNSTIIGDGAHTWQFTSRIIEYNHMLSLEAGNYMITFTPENSNYGYRASVGDIIFIPQGADNSVAAKDYVNSATGYEIPAGNQNIAVTYNKQGTITIPVNVLADGYYNLVMDLYAKMSESENSKSPLWMQLDDETPVLLSEDNTTLLQSGVDTYPNIGSMHEYKYNRQLYLTAKEHTVTFSVTEPTVNHPTLYLTAIGEIAVKEVKPIEEIMISGFGSNMNIGGNQKATIYDAAYNEISADNVAALTFTSSDTNVATVDGTGMVSAVGNGKATITATVRQFATSDNELTATVDVYVYDNGICIYNKQGAEATLKANKAKETVCVVMAKYDGSRMLASDIVYTGAAEKSVEIPLNAEFGAVGENETVRIFVWDTMAGQQPVCGVVEY